jgi:hypothetical protein
MRTDLADNVVLAFVLHGDCAVFKLLHLRSLVFYNSCT